MSIIKKKPYYIDVPTYKHIYTLYLALNPY